MAALASVLVVALLATVGVLLWWSHPGEPRPFLDASGQSLSSSISEKIRVQVNGARQGMILRGRDRTRPVLLYLHGGLPEYFLTESPPTGIEDLFTVCWWDQRGSGLSYSPGIPRGQPTVEQLVEDTLEVTRYLRGRFGQERIYLMGHSGGTFFGIQAAARAPELFHAYVGVAQMSRQLQSEIRAYDDMLEHYRARGDRRMVRRLEAAPVTLDGVPTAYLRLRDQAMHGLGVGTTRDMRSVVRGVFLASLRSRQYTLGEKIGLWRGKAASGVSCMWDEILATDLADRVPEVAVPVHFLHGAFDYTCSYAEARAYFDKLHAPLKGFYTFTESAHSPILEEPQKAQTILREDVLAGTNRLADPR